MSKNAEQKIKEYLESMEGLYYQLILVVGQSGTGKTNLLQNIARKFNKSLININLTISKEYMELTKKQRKLEVAKTLDKIVGKSDGIILLDNIEILFDNDLEQNPLRLLQGLARKRKIVASWGGMYKDGKISYAEPWHHEYRKYDAKDILIVDLNTNS